MAKSLKNIVGKRIVQTGVLLSALALAPAVGAQGLSDPTRPPASMQIAQQGSPEPLASGPVLQSVLVSPGWKVAIISGQMVKLGEKFGDARVVKITESEVTLSSSNGMQTLKLFPGIEKDVASNRKHLQTDSRR